MEEQFHKNPSALFLFEVDRSLSESSENRQRYLNVPDHVRVAPAPGALVNVTTPVLETEYAEVGVPLICTAVIETFWVTSGRVRMSRAS